MLKTPAPGQDPEKNGSTAVPDSNDFFVRPNPSPLPRGDMKNAPQNHSTATLQLQCYGKVLHITVCSCISVLIRVVLLLFCLCDLQRLA